MKPQIHQILPPPSETEELIAQGIASAILLSVDVPHKGISAQAQTQITEFAKIICVEAPMALLEVVSSNLTNSFVEGTTDHGRVTEILDYVGKAIFIGRPGFMLGMEPLLGFVQNHSGIWMENGPAGLMVGKKDQKIYLI